MLRDEIARIIDGVHDDGFQNAEIDELKIADEIIAKVDQSGSVSSYVVWISVSDRLPSCNPEDRVWQLVCTSRNGNMEVASFWLGEWVYSNGQRVYGVTHWMPLPEPPKQ